MTGTSPNREELNRDLGFGTRLANETRARLMNPDGSFNARREGGSRFLNTYHWMLTMPWPKFHLMVGLYYLSANLLFAIGYTLCGPGALTGSSAGTAGERFVDAFFFSVQTLSTIGYGRMTPSSLPANILVGIEALAGLLGFALATGLLFARFSRPSARIIFSSRAVIAPYGNGKALEFRVVNARSNELIELKATVLLARKERIDGRTVRKFYPLPLERSQVMFLPLHWVVVHPIDQSSALYASTPESLADADAEILILLTATDETFAQSVHARSSYKHDEIVWDAKFSDIFNPSDDAIMSIDMRKIHDIEPAITR